MASLADCKSDSKVPVVEDYTDMSVMIV